MQTSYNIILIRFVYVHTIRTVLNWQIVSDFRKYSIFVQKSQIPSDRHIAALARRLVKKEILHRARVNIQGLTIVKKQEEDNYKIIKTVDELKGLADDRLDEVMEEVANQ